MARFFWWLFLAVSVATWCAVVFYGGEWLLTTNPKLFVGVALFITLFVPLFFALLYGALTRWGKL